MLSSLFNFDAVFAVFSGLFTPPSEWLFALFLLVVMVLLVNVVLLIIFAIVGSAFLTRMHIASGDLEQQRRDAHEKSEFLLERARHESLRIVEEANKKAGELIQQTQAVKNTFESEIDSHLKDFSKQETERVAAASRQMIDMYRQMLESSKQQYGSAMASTAKEMAGDAQKSIQIFGEFLKEQTVRYEGALHEQIQAGFMSTQKEISDYKRESLRKVEDAIYRILSLVSKSVLGHALSLEDQQDLVVRALDEAKKQGFFEL